MLGMPGAKLRLLLPAVVFWGLSALLGLAAGGVACSSSGPRDQHYGDDAGSDFRPPQWDGPVDAKDAADAAADAPVADATADAEP